MRSRHRARRAFTLIEVIVIVIIIGVIAAVIAPRLLSRVGSSKQSVAAANAATLAGQLKLFALDFGMPEEGSSITVLWERPGGIDEDTWRQKGGPFVDNADTLIDPWGRQYVLIIPGQKNVDFDVVSYGKDGQPGGTGEDQDIIKP